METNPNIIYLEGDQMKVVFTSCFFRVDHILKRVGSLHRFQELMERAIVTNGKLVGMADMTFPAFHLEETIEKNLLPLGFAFKTDYIFLEEQMIHGVGHSITSNLNQPIPGCEQAPWLHSQIRMNGNYVWFVGD